MNKINKQTKSMTKEKISVIIRWYRIYSKLWNKHLYILSKFLYYLSRILFNCNIPPTAKLGENVNVGHAQGIVIHQNCVVGKNTLIYQNVTIGRRNGSKEESPKIGENCVIGAGACILGDITIGNNVKIGANAVVVESIPSNCTFVPAKGRMIQKDND